MGDRQDIDALLIGRLYGELDAADEARLETHLASHPADRAAMDSLAETRSRVRDQLATLPQSEPAPAISTLILQEAARRAPRKAATPQKEGGVLAWLSGLFQPVARHPALAGALALVLVGGAAGVLYDRGKVDSAEHATHTGEAPRAPAPTAAPSVDHDGDADVALAKDADKSGEKKPDPNLDSYQVQLADRSDENGITTKGAIGDGKMIAANKPSQDPSAAATHASGSAGHAGYVTVTRPERQPKTMDDQRAIRGAGGGGGAAMASSGSAAGQRPPADMGGGPGGTISGEMAGDDASPTTGTATAPPPAPTPKATTDAGAAPATPGAYSQSQDAKLTEWAQVQHKQLVALVKAGNCTEAGKIGSEIAAKAPEYYAAHIENDRSVRSCKQYIDQGKRKKANEAYKSRAHNAYEPDLEAPAAAQ